MTKKILIDETVVKQAIWTLERLGEASDTDVSPKKWYEARGWPTLEALEAVIADQKAAQANNEVVNATEPVAGQTRPLGYLPKWSVDRLTGDMGKVADPLVWGLYTHVYLSSVDHSVAIYTSPQSAATQPLTDEQRDAARYRWLRENRATLLITGFFGNGCINRAIDEVDKAIDRAIEAAHHIGVENEI